MLKSSQRHPIPRRTIAFLTWEATENRTMAAAATNNTSRPVGAAASHYSASTGRIGGLTAPLWPDALFPSSVDINRVFLSSTVFTTTAPILLTVYPKLFQQYRILETKIGITFHRTWLDPTGVVPKTAFDYQPMYAFILASSDLDAFDTNAEDITFVSLSALRQQRFVKLKKIDPAWMTTRAVRLSMKINPSKIVANGHLYKQTNTFLTASAAAVPWNQSLSITGETPQLVYIWWGIVTQDGSLLASAAAGAFTTRSDLKLTHKTLLMEPHANQELSAL